MRLVPMRLQRRFPTKRAGCEREAERAANTVRPATPARTSAPSAPLTITPVIDQAACRRKVELSLSGKVELSPSP